MDGPGKWQQGGNDNLLHSKMPNPIMTDKCPSNKQLSLYLQLKTVIPLLYLSGHRQSIVVLNCRIIGRIFPRIAATRTSSETSLKEMSCSH